MKSIKKPYKKEAQQKYGKDKVERSEQIVKGWSKEKFAAVRAEGLAITKELAGLVNEPIESPKVQAAIDKHFHHIIQFYDASWPHIKIYRGLADLYVNDPRFAKNYTKHHPDLAKFMQAAMTYYCSEQDNSAF